jgi:uncharacterized protein (TIGR03086 family)
MPVAAPPLTLLQRALDQLERVIAGIDPGRREDPTPCASWNVSQLMQHLMNDFAHFIPTARGEVPDRSAPVPQMGDDWVREFHARADELKQAWSAAGDLSGSRELPRFGSVPADFPVFQQLSEMATHAWDLARATGQQLELDGEVAEAGLGWATKMLKPEFRGTEAEGKAFGPEVTVADDASAPDRLAAWFGRRP